MVSSQALLGLDRPPVAIGFLDAPPAGVAPWDGGPVAAGCAFWKAAWEGRTFYTTPADHYNCAVGAHTHKISLPMAREGELMDTVGFMVGSGYLKMEEVPGIPTLSAAPAAIAYGPADGVRFAPDVVLVALKPAQAMLLYEAALQAGAALMPALGRPACAILPLSLGTGAAALSLGCAGNRTFTDLPESEMYVSVPGARWEPTLESFAAVLRANAIMGDHYARKAADFASR